LCVTVDAHGWLQAVLHGSVLSGMTLYVTVDARGWLQAVLHGSIHAAYVVQTERQKLTQSFRRERPHFPFPVVKFLTDRFCNKLD